MRLESCMPPKITYKPPAADARASSLMSLPRPTMLVVTVTEPKWPALARMRFSSSKFSVVNNSGVTPNSPSPLLKTLWTSLACFTDFKTTITGWPGLGAFSTVPHTFSAMAWAATISSGVVPASMLKTISKISCFLFSHPGSTRTCVSETFLRIPPAVKPSTICSPLAPRPVMRVRAKGLP